MRANLSVNAKGKYKFYGQLKLLLTPESSEHSARSTWRLLLGQDCSVESKGKIEVKAVFRIRKFCLDPDSGYRSKIIVPLPDPAQKEREDK